jgi:uncharacterized protein with von Willebrand factor type A (vWA) domain
MSIRAHGGTNINDALVEAIKKIKEVKEAAELDPKTKQMIMFLTDGEATIGVTHPYLIKNNIQKFNKVCINFFNFFLKNPYYCLNFEF